MPETLPRSMKTSHRSWWKVFGFWCQINSRTFPSCSLSTFSLSGCYRTFLSPFNYPQNQSIREPPSLFWLIAGMSCVYENRNWQLKGAKFKLFAHMWISEICLFRFGFCRAGWHLLSRLHGNVWRNLQTTFWRCKITRSLSTDFVEFDNWSERFDLFWEISWISS